VRRSTAPQSPPTFNLRSPFASLARRRTATPVTTARVLRKAPDDDERGIKKAAEIVGRLGDFGWRVACFSPFRRSNSVDQCSRAAVVIMQHHCVPDNGTDVGGWFTNLLMTETYCRDIMQL